jgi:hypothetical protein
MEAGVHVGHFPNLKAENSKRLLRILYKSSIFINQNDVLQRKLLFAKLLSV